MRIRSITIRIHKNRAYITIRIHNITIRIHNITIRIQNNKNT